MVKSNLMSRISKTTKLSRNRFDISCNRDFTAPVGALLPVYWRELTPNTHVSLNVNSFTRTLPMQKANYGKIREEFDVFFVPLRLICSDAQEMLTGTPLRTIRVNEATEAGMYYPNVTYKTIRDNILNSSVKVSDACGYPLHLGAKRLLDMLGYSHFMRTSSTGFTYDSLSSDDIETANPSSNSGRINWSNAFGSSYDNMAFSLMPICAYQKIYADYFRNKLWEDEDVYNYQYQCQSGNSPSSDSSTHLRGTFELRYSNYDADRIFGMIPDTGNIFSIGITDVNTINIPTEYALGTAQGGNSRLRLVPNARAAFPVGAFNGDLDDYLTNTSVTNYFQLLANSTNSGDDFGVNSVDNSSSNGSAVNFDAESQAMLRTAFGRLTALNLSRMQALQRFAEVVALNKDDYKHQISALFGITPSDANSYYCQYLGGKTSSVNVSDIEQTSPSDGTTKLGDLAGRGTAFGRGANVDFTASEHGVLMVIYHLQPEVAFDSNSFDPQLFRFGRYDFMIPQFGNLGFEPVCVKDVANPLWLQSAMNSDVNIINPYVTLGYLPRYWSYKTDVDKVFGNFSAIASNEYDSYVIKFDLPKYLTSIAWKPQYGSFVDYRFFKVNPTIVDPLFYVNYDPSTDAGVESTDEFIVASHFDIIADMPLSVDGLPY